MLTPSSTYAADDGVCGDLNGSFAVIHSISTRLELQGSLRPPLERTDRVALYEVAREVARQLGQDLKEGGTGGGSDGNFTAAIGVPTLDGLGPRGDGAHALHEYVELDDLVWRAAFLALLLSRLGTLHREGD